MKLRLILTVNLQVLAGNFIFKPANGFTTNNRREVEITYFMLMLLIAAAFSGMLPI